MKCGVLLVIYNRRCADSPACETLRQAAEPLTVLIADNSTADFDNAAYCAAADFTYLPQGGNVGLARAYNAGLDALRAAGVTHVTLLDDDTALPTDYFALLRQAADSRPEVGIWLPIVTDERGLLSPCAIRGCRVRRLNPDEHPPQAALSGINSGLTMVLSAIGSYRYDERYFLDYIDHAFLRDMKRRGVSIGTFDACLQQRFADNAGDHDAAMRRYQLFKKDFRLFCGNGFSGRCAAAAGLFKRRLSLWRTR